jgi:hypothetical protein
LTGEYNSTLRKIDHTVISSTTNPSVIPLTKNPWLHAEKLATDHVTNGTDMQCVTIQTAGHTTPEM